MTDARRPDGLEVGDVLEVVSVERFFVDFTTPDANVAHYEWKRSIVKRLGELGVLGRIVYSRVDVDSDWLANEFTYTMHYQVEDLEEAGPEIQQASTLQVVAILGVALAAVLVGYYVSTSVERLADTADNALETDPELLREVAKTTQVLALVALGLAVLYYFGKPLSKTIGA